MQYVSFVLRITRVEVKGNDLSECDSGLMNKEVSARMRTRCTTIARQNIRRSYGIPILIDRLSTVVNSGKITKFRGKEYLNEENEEIKVYDPIFDR